MRAVETLVWSVGAGVALLAVMPGHTGGQAVTTAAAAEERVEAAAETGLVYEREVFVYSRAGRRDPFTPLTGDQGLNPRFEDLTLQGVIHSPRPRESVALLADRHRRVYRVRAGDVVGNVRVLDIAPNRVRVAVTTFGVVRQEQLELRARENRNPGAVTVPAAPPLPPESGPDADDGAGPPDEPRQDAPIAPRAQGADR